GSSDVCSSDLVQVVRGRDAHAAAHAAGAGILAVAPQGQGRGPVVQRVALWVAVPAAAQLDGVLAAAQRHLVHALFEGPQHRRQAGAAEGDAGRAVGDVVVVADPAGRVAIEEPRVPGRVGPDGHAGVAVGVHREGGQPAAVAGEQRQLDAHPGAGAAVHELLRPAQDDPHRRGVQAGQLHGGDDVGGDVDLGAEAAAHVLGHDVDLLGTQLPALGRLLGDAGHGLGGQVEVQVLALPPGHAAVRLHAGVGLHAGGAGGLHGGDDVGGDVDLGAEAAAHVLGHDVDLLGTQLPALGRLLGDAGHGLGGQVEVQVLALPPGHAAVRLHAGVGLHAGGEGGLHQ